MACKRVEMYKTKGRGPRGRPLLRSDCDEGGWGYLDFGGREGSIFFISFYFSLSFAES